MRPRLAAIRALLAAAAFALAALAAPAARASDMDQFGFGARPISMGNAFTALATDFTGAYYNPAAPAASKNLSVGAGFSYGHYALEYTSETGPNDADVEDQDALSAFTIGFSTPLDQEPDSFLSRFALALGLFLPTRAIVGAEIETAPGTPQYFLYGSRRDKIGITAAVAVRVLPIDPGGEQILCVGGGATILADISGEFTFDLSASAARSVAVEQKLSHDAAPNFGIFFWPAPWISLGVAYRGELSLKADFDVQIVVDGTNLFPLVLEAVTLFQPQQVAAGVAVDPFEWLTVSFDVTWANWEAYEDPFVTIRPVVPQADVPFRDIWIPRLGVEVEPLHGVAIRGGYYYQRSPIPSQGGATNLIDLDKHVLSFGAGWTYWRKRDRVAREGDTAEIVSEDENPFSLDLFFQWHHLIDERVAKDPAASPQTGSFYEAGGDIFNVGFQITIRT